MNKLVRYVISDSGKYKVRSMNKPPKSYVGILQDDYDPLDEKYLKVSIGTDQDGNDVTLFTVDTDKKAADAAVKAGTDLLTEKYIAMNTEVLTEMANVFGTTNPASAQANYETFKTMSSNATVFIDLEAPLYADKDLGSFVKGQHLDTASKIKAFADLRIVEIVTYGVWRVKRIDQFRKEKELITG